MDAWSTARSTRGSKNTALARCVTPRRSTIVGLPMPATTCALVTTRPGRTTKPDPRWLAPCLAEDLHDGWAGLGHRGAYHGVGRRREVRRRGRFQSGEDVWVSQRIEQSSYAREHRRRCRQDPVGGAQDFRVLNRGCDRRVGHPGDNARDEGAEQERGGRGEDSSGRGVDGPEAGSLDGAPGANAEDSRCRRRQGGSRDEGRDEQDDPGRRVVAKSPRVRCEQGGQCQSAPQAGEGDDLRGSAEPDAVDDGSCEQHQDQQVDRVHCPVASTALGGPGTTTRFLPLCSAAPASPRAMAPGA